MAYIQQFKTIEKRSWNGIPIMFNCKLLIISLLLLLGNINMLNGLKCVCNQSECDFIKQDDCPGKGYMVWDPCKCCKVCAKIEGEACGGPGGFSGTCEFPLKCITKPPIIGTGVCLDLPPVDHLESIRSQRLLKCQETVIVEPGCEIVDKLCKCWPNRVTMCKEQQIKWDFKNIDECELNLGNLMQNEVDFDEDYTLSPKNFDS